MTGCLGDRKGLKLGAYSVLCTRPRMTCYISLKWAPYFHRAFMSHKSSPFPPTISNHRLKSLLKAITYEQSR